MNKSIETRVLKLGEYIIDNKSTIRETAKFFGISKSTVHKDLAQRLKNINFSIYTDVKKILEINKSERHIRGGFATKNKYAKKNLK
ncbi:MAG: sporulation transcriptional regulator SpoIIID [Clostridia bacterium]|nr:sporulation transcriptional regulator SpoIIID [Clostridia bacterium]MBQ3093446.1 sporulation transcriptional regulator SpoIIID [Clostridia bacterium]